MLYEEVLALGKCNLSTVDQKTEPEKWAALRTTGIGGSDAGAIMGINKYASPLSVYLSKKDLSSFEGNGATKWGHILEDPVRQAAREDLGIQIEEVPGMLRSNEIEFLNANLDGVCYVEGTKEITGVVVSGLGGHEIKTSKSGEGFGEDEIPDSYFAQVQHYMKVTGLPFFILSVFIIDSYTIKHYAIERNDFFITDLVNAETDFWENYVMTDTPPAPTGCDNEKDSIANLPMDSEIDLPDEFIAVIEERAAIEAQIKELTKKSDALKETVLLEMFRLSNGENAEKTTAHCGTYKITYNTQVRKSIDTDALKKAGLYDGYTKESVSKVMRVSGGK